jgi:hypothetical protein
MENDELRRFCIILKKCHHQDNRSHFFFAGYNWGDEGKMKEMDEICSTFGEIRNAGNSLVEEREVKIYS